MASDLFELGHLVTNVSRGAQNLFVSDSSGVDRGEFQRRLEFSLAGMRPMRERWEQVGSEISIQLVDEQGAPVQGALVGTNTRWSGGQIQSTKQGASQPALVVSQSAHRHAAVLLLGTSGVHQSQERVRL